MLDTCEEWDACEWWLAWELWPLDGGPVTGGGGKSMGIAEYPAVIADACGSGAAGALASAEPGSAPTVSAARAAPIDATFLRCIREAYRTRFAPSPTLGRTVDKPRGRGAR